MDEEVVTTNSNKVFLQTFNHNEDKWEWKQSLRGNCMRLLNLNLDAYTCGGLGEKKERERKGLSDNYDFKTAKKK